MIGERKSAVRADAVVTGKLHGNPSLHAPALNKDHLIVQRRGERCTENFRQVSGKDFQSIADIQSESRHEQTTVFQFFPEKKKASKKDAFPTDVIPSPSKAI